MFYRGCVTRSRVQSRGTVPNIYPANFTKYKSFPLTYSNTLKLHEVAPWIEFGLNHHWSLISIKSSSSSTSRNSKIIISSYFLVCAVPCHFLSCTFTGVLHCPVCTLLSNPKKILFGIILFKNETGLIIFWNYSFLPSGCWTFLLWERSIFHSASLWTSFVFNIHTSLPLNQITRDWLYVWL